MYKIIFKTLENLLFTLKSKPNQNCIVGLYSKALI